LSRIFTPDYQAFGFVLIGYLVGLVPFSLVFMSQRAFYSLGDTRTPFFFTLAQVVVIVAGVLLCFLVAPDLRAAAIALVVSIAGGIQAVIAIALLRRRIGGVDGRRIASGLWRFLVAAAASMIAGAGVLLLLGGVSPGAFPVSGFFAAVVSIALAGVIMLAVYIGALVVLRSSDLRTGIAPLTNRLGRRSEHTDDAE
jgi:putative peptidoglycan lipid II flippase